MASRGANGAATRAGARLTGFRVLVVGDHADRRSGLASLLGVEGAAALVAGTAHHAIAIVCNERLDVVLTDLDLPDMPGEILIREIAETRSRPRIIVVTAYGEPRSGLARQAGAEIVLTRPVLWNEVVEAIRRPHRAG